MARKPFRHLRWWVVIFVIVAAALCSSDSNGSMGGCEDSGITLVTARTANVFR